MQWTVLILNRTVEEELEALPDDMQARFSRIATLIQEHGLKNVGMPHVRPLKGKLWEMRLTGRDGIARALYFTATGRGGRRPGIR